MHKLHYIHEAEHDLIVILEHLIYYKFIPFINIEYFFTYSLLLGNLPVFLMQKVGEWCPCFVLQFTILSFCCSMDVAHEE